MQAEFISKITNRKEHSCSCAKCQDMCRTPCLGLPGDMLAIAKAGYANRLSSTVWLAGVPVGIPPIVIIAPLLNQAKNACTFFAHGKCELHDKGLKPLEGKLATHDPIVISKITNAPIFMIALSWCDNKETNTVLELLNLMK